MILADDLGWADAGQDSSRIDTPNIRRLREQGIRLTSFYSSASLCSPARAALLTGRYPHSVGVPDLASPLPRNNVPVLSLNHDAITLPEVLKKTNYRSMLAGKWHLGYDQKSWPRTHGFDEFWGSLIGTPGYYDARQTYHNETPIKADGYLTDRITEKAIEFIRRQNNPFFLYVAYNAPHYPLEAPAALVYKYRTLFPEDGLFAIYAAMVERMDEGIGRILNTLDSLQLTGNTLVVFASDNGPSAEPRSYGLSGARLSAGPLRDHKFSTHEGGIRVPFIARWPGRIPAGSGSDEPAIMMDLMPTFLDACGIRPERGHQMHGRSILPQLKGIPSKTERVFYWEDQYNLAVRKGNWKLVQRFFEERPHLYNLATDIGEMTDLAGKRPDIVSELTGLHAAWKKQYYPNPIPHTVQRSDYIFPRK
jgi:arylsulfatase A-like enzyme